MPKIADAYVELEARTGKYRADITKAKRATASFGASARVVTTGEAINRPMSVQR